MFSMAFFGKNRKTKEIQQEKATPNTDKQIGVCKNNSRDWQEGRYETATTIEKSLKR